MGAMTAAIVGPGNIGTDLLAKLQRSEHVEVRYMVGVDAASEGLERARRLGAQVSAGPGTRANIDEFTVTTARAIESVGGAGSGKAVIILNPVDPPMIMRDTVFCAISPDADHDAITDSVLAMAAEVARYVPGYTLRADPQFDPPAPDWGGWARVAVFLEVRGNGDYLPAWAGNLDIMTAAAARVGEVLAAAARTGATT